MINDKNLTQESGDNSTNYQAHAIHITNGISYSDAREIALSVYKENFMQLSQDAAQLAATRAEKLTDDFLEKLKQENEAALQSMSNPSMQIALYNAQKAFASTGDNELEEVLVNILVDRAKENNRTIKQITLDEAILVASKLTFEQMDAITLNFLISRTRKSNLLNRESVKNYIEDELIFLAEKINFETSIYEHLEYTGCGSLMDISTLKPINQIFKEQYTGLFSKGGEFDDYKELINDPKAKELVIKCLNFPNLYQINAIEESVIDFLSKKYEISADLTAKAKEIFVRHTMSDEEVKEDLLKLCPGLSRIFDLWEKTKISKFTLTTVGIAIAQANIKRNFNENIDLGVWVK